MAKQHIVYLTEEELKAVANLARVAMKQFGHVEYVQQLEANGGKSGFDKLVAKINELKGK